MGPGRDRTLTPGSAVKLLPPALWGLVIMANSEDPDEMQRKAAFHKGLLCLQRHNRSSEKEFFFYILGTYNL